jgi:hypothetical protein
VPGLQRRSAYGLCCEIGFDWSWAPACPSGATPALHIQLGAPAPQVGAIAYETVAVRTGDRGAERPAMLLQRAADGQLRIAYADGATFVIDRTGAHIHGSADAPLGLDDLIVYLQGSVLGFVLRLRGAMCLHASAVEMGGRAFALVGSRGMGKSTSAAAFARMGLSVLTDDVLALEEGASGFDALPGLPRVMLWPESVHALWGSADALPRAVANWDKRYLDLAQPGYHFASRQVPLAAIYVLGERIGSADAPMIHELRGADALVELVTNTYSNDLLDARQRADELDVLGRLASQVRVRRVHAPDDRAAISATCAAIVDDFRGMKAS